MERYLARTRLKRIFLKRDSILISSLENQRVHMTRSQKRVDRHCYAHQTAVAVVKQALDMTPEEIQQLQEQDEMLTAVKRAVEGEAHQQMWNSSFEMDSGIECGPLWANMHKR